MWFRVTQCTRHISETRAHRPPYQCAGTRFARKSCAQNSAFRGPWLRTLNIIKVLSPMQIRSNCVHERAAKSANIGHSQICMPGARSCVLEVVYLIDNPNLGTVRNGCLEPVVVFRGPLPTRGPKSVNCVRYRQLSDMKTWVFSLCV